jgi:hypothetical protein
MPLYFFIGICVRLMCGKLTRNRFNHNLCGIVIIAAGFAILLTLGYILSASYIMQKAMAVDTTTTSTASNKSISIGKPFYLQQDKILSKKALNKSGDLQIFYAGHGLTSGLNVTDNGLMYLSYGPVGTGLYKTPLYLHGQGVITTKDGERASYAFQSVGYTDKNGNTKHNGITVFISGPTVGKLAFLMVPSNMVGVFTSEISNSGNIRGAVWTWEH